MSWRLKTRAAGGVWEEGEHNMIWVGDYSRSQPILSGAGQFGAVVLALPFWRRRFGAGRFGAGRFGATTGKQRHKYKYEVSVYERTLNGDDRTNNHVEAAHRKFQAEFGMDHPTIWKFIDGISELFKKDVTACTNNSFVETKLL